MPFKDSNSKNNDIKFEALFNSASMAIIVVDKHGVIVMANHYANNLFA
jgi:sensor histidine kinase regulating citrate/malate metabolism